MSVFTLWSEVEVMDESIALMKRGDLGPEEEF